MLQNRHHILFLNQALWFQRATMLALLATATVAHAQVNDWISPVSGFWDVATNWSAGLPNSNQVEVRITNANSKAVAIQPSTPIAFPDSMTVRNLRVGGVPPDANLLLLNFVGPATPLRVLNDFNLEANGRVLMLSSGLNVSNVLNLNGVFDQEGGELTFTNSPASRIQIEGGHFNLTNGVVNGSSLYFGGSNDGFMNQDSGLVSVNWLVLGSGPVFGTGAGTYVLRDGWLIVNTHELVGQHGVGTLIQNGGTNSASDLAVGAGTYVKNGGALFAGEVRGLAPYSIMTHAGGTAMITNVLRLQGRIGDPLPKFNMLGGSLSTPRIQLEKLALFVQSNGTVHVANELFIDNDRFEPSTYSLYGGTLFANNTTVSSPSGFGQSGGIHFVTNTLGISSDTTYSLSGGILTAPNIVLSGNFPNPPQLLVLGAPPFIVSNGSISLFNGVILIQDSAQHFGRLTLPADSELNLAGNSAMLYFADSHTNSWESQLFGVVPRLTVYGWAGSTNGGGADQLGFGSNSSSLSASQVRQIHFINPSGFASGTYPARILSTGEVVPMPRPVLGWQKSGTNLVLSWPGNFILQSATNVVGPYLDVTNPSPYSVNVNQFPMQFFRLRD